MLRSKNDKEHLHKEMETSKGELQGYFRKLRDAGY